MGISDYCVFDPSIVRGLAYYTGIVFEVHDVRGNLRAIGGGGRFDNLLHDFGGPKISATGMGMGDCVLEILLREKGLLDEKIPARTLDYFILSVSDALLDEAVKLTARLRTLGFKSVFTYKSASLSKQLKLASEQNAKYCIIIGDELKTGNIALKNMSTGKQQTIPLRDFVENPAKFTV
jgi:histidyl-tRNA synthetase